jgi:phospholipid transport system transporter-binding protein
LKESPHGNATFESLSGDRSRVVGSLEFTTVSRLLPLGSAAIVGGRAAVIDLAGVTDSDSSGLALLIEWLSVAKEAGRPLHYDNMPAQLHQLASLSEVEGLFTAAVPAAAPVSAAGSTAPASV